jgi:hypothetical protein
MAKDVGSILIGCEDYLMMMALLSFTMRSKMSPSADVTSPNGPGSEAADGVGLEIFCAVAEAPAFAPAEQRRAKRQRVLKMAELVFDPPGTFIDCVVIDESCFGVMLETMEITQVPERVKIRFVGGPTFSALRRWADGNKVGLEFAGLFPEDEATKRQARAVKNVLKEACVHAAVQMLRELDFFENAELRAAAEQAEIAIAKLESALL